MVSGTASLVQVKKAKDSVANIVFSLQHKSEYTPMIRMLSQIAQNFASGSATKKVLKLLQDLLDNVYETRAAV